VLEILGETNLNDRTRTELKAKFNEYKEAGQIEFITFHQSFSYEEFVEGIKPDLDNDENDQIKYNIKDGIFKELCKKALKNYNFSQNSQNEKQYFNDLINKFAENIQERLDNNEKVVLKNEATIKKINFDSNYNFKSFILGGSVNYQSLTLDIIQRDWQNKKLQRH